MGIDVSLYAIGEVSVGDIVRANAFLTAALPARNPGATWPVLSLEDYDDSRIVFWSQYRAFPEYRRGQWPAIHAEIIALQAALPTCVIHYGPDTSDDCRVVDAEYLAELWAEHERDSTRDLPPRLE